MSATEHTANYEDGAVAYVNFRVRCESLGHGETIFLIAAGNHSNIQKSIPLFTTASNYPWYNTLSPLTLPLPPRVAQERKRYNFVYRYAIHRAGVFHRWEDESDAPEELIELKLSSYPGKIPILPSDLHRSVDLHHELPLHLMTNQEAYVVNDVLGHTKGRPDIDHVRVRTSRTYTKAASLHARSATAQDALLRVATDKNVPNVPRASKTRLSAASPISTRSKTVGFTTPAPRYQRHKSEGLPLQGVSLNNTDGLVVVSIFLPVIVHRSDNGRWTAEWDDEILLSMQTHLRVTRVGCVKWRNSDRDTGGVPRHERDEVAACLQPFNCVPVWIDPVQFHEMYNGFCKGVLWPLFHNLTSVYSNRPDDNNVQNRTGSTGDPTSQFSEYSMDDVEQGPLHGGRGREGELWSAYQTVNLRFAEVVVQCFNEGDLVWVHGFHLLILPSYLSRRIPMAKVGLFLHTPFPSSEIFRTCWCREQLIRGMLNADQVGFHLFEYARHFLTSCRRLLGLNYGMILDSSGGHSLAIDTNGRHVVITSIHAGIEAHVLDDILQRPQTIENANIQHDKFVGKHVLCGIDRLESLKGIPLKLLALERFLTRCPEWKDKVVLVQIGISAFERGEDYVKTKAEVQKLVNKINSVYPDTVYFYECLESEMRLQQRMAILRAADTVVVTSIRDGLNLLPLEFTMAHKDIITDASKREDGRKRGTVILSEFSSSTRVMRGALHINPWKISEIANAYYIALHMSEEERLRRIMIAYEFVKKVTTHRWALAVLLDLKGVYKNVNPVQVSGAGLGLTYRVLGMDIGFITLDPTLVAKAYRNSRARLILLDYGGTIVSNDNLNNLIRFQMVKERSAPSEPTDEMISTIMALCEDKRNVVFVVSGKEKHSLTNVFGRVPNLGLAAEHGMFISWPNKVRGHRRWENLVLEYDRTWRTLAMSIMEVYTSRTHGSYIEETEMKVLWQYRDADTEFGSLQAKELEDHLSKYLRSFPVDILHGGVKEGGFVEVRPKGVNKGVLAMRLIENLPNVTNMERIDFALVLGDDHCDEPMLSVMRQIGRRANTVRRAQNGHEPLPDMPATIQLVDVSSCDTYVSPNIEVFTCTVGKKPSAAANYLEEVGDVQALLSSLVRVSTRDPRYYSNVDLVSYSGSPQFSHIQPLRPISGVPRSASLNEIASNNDGNGQSLRSVSTSLNQYLRLGTIGDDVDEDIEEKEDDANFF